MHDQQPLTPSQVGAAIKAFRSEWCPACGIEKHRNQESFCEGCLLRLPTNLREGISDRKQFIELFHPALACIKQNAVDSPSNPLALLPLLSAARLEGDIN